MVLLAVGICARVMLLQGWCDFACLASRFPKSSRVCELTSAQPPARTPLPHGTVVLAALKHSMLVLPTPAGYCKDDWSCSSRVPAATCASSRRGRQQRGAGVCCLGHQVGSCCKCATGAGAQGGQQSDHGEREGDGHKHPICCLLFSLLLMCSIQTGIGATVLLLCCV